MNTHNYIHKIFILSLLSIVHSDKNNNFEHMQANIRTGFVRNIHSYIYIYKKSQHFHIILNICKSIVNKNCF